MTQVICRLCCLILRRVFQAKLSFSIPVYLYQVSASGMVYGIVSCMSKILYYTTYPTSVPYQLMPYTGPGNLQKDSLSVKGQIICLSTDLLIC